MIDLNEIILFLTSRSKSAACGSGKQYMPLGATTYALKTCPIGIYTVNPELNSI